MKAPPRGQAAGGRLQGGAASPPPGLRTRKGGGDKTLHPQVCLLVPRAGRTKDRVCLGTTATQPGASAPRRTGKGLEYLPVAVRGPLPTLASGFPAVSRPASPTVTHLLGRALGKAGLRGSRKFRLHCGQALAGPAAVQRAVLKASGLPCRRDSETPAYALWCPVCPFGYKPRVGHRSWGLDGGVSQPAPEASSQPCLGLRDRGHPSQAPQEATREGGLGYGQGN